MSTFYYNPNNNKDVVSQWLTYKQERSYVKDIVNSQNATQDIIQQQFSHIRNSIDAAKNAQVASNQQIRSAVQSTTSAIEDTTSVIQEGTFAIMDTLDKTTKAVKETTSAVKETTSTIKESTLTIEKSISTVCGSIDRGVSLTTSKLNGLNFRLSDIKSELSYIVAILNWSFSELITNQKITNLFLGNIAELLVIPEFQKERRFFVEQGLKFLQNSAFDDTFFIDALGNFKKAEKLEPSDYFTMHNIGLIYLNSPKHIDLGLAEQYFKKSAKYSSAETHQESAITKDLTNLDPSKPFDEQISVNSIKLHAAESYLYAGRCCYIQGKIEEAIELAKKSIKLVPEFLEANYLYAKSLSANGEIKNALKIMGNVVDKNSFYTVKMLGDMDFATKEETVVFLNDKKNEAIAKAKNELSEIEKRILKKSEAHSLIVEAKNLLEEDNYLSAKRALDIIG